MVLSSCGPLTVALAILIAALPSLVAQDEEPLTVEQLRKLGRFEEALLKAAGFEKEWAQEVEEKDTVQAWTMWSRSLHSLGVIEEQLNMYQESLEHLRLARDITIEGQFGSSRLGDVLDALGQAEYKAGEYDEAEKSLRRAIELREEEKSKEGKKWLAASQTHLGLVFLTTGRYNEAGRILHESLTQALEIQDVDLLVLCHESLGRYFHIMRSYSKAADHLERALEIAIPERGDGDQTSISLYGQLGLANLRLGEEERDEARRYLTKAATLARSQRPSRVNRFSLASHLSNLGSLRLEENKNEEAKSIFLESLGILKSLLGEDAPSLAPYYTNLGFVSQKLGDFEAAQSAYQKSVELYRSSVGTHHQSYLEAAQNHLESLFLASGPTEDLARQITNFTATALDLFDDIISFGTERQRINWLRENHLLTLPCSQGSDPAFIANTILRTKARILDSLLAEQDAAQHSEAGELLRQFHLKQRELDDLLLRSAEQEAVNALRDEIAVLEGKVRGSQDGKPQASTQVTWQEVQATLPARSAFVDYVRFTDLTQGPTGALAYGAILILPEGEPKWIALGTDVDLAIWLGIFKARLDYRSYLLASREDAPPPALRMSSALSRLHELFWAPVATHLPAATETIAISPDASLNFLSFAVLLDENNKFLADRFRQLVYYSSARDMLVQDSRPALRAGPWAVIAVPEFENKDATDVPMESLDDMSKLLLETISAFPDVPGAEEELRLLQKILPSGQDNTELINANEEQVRNLKTSPVVLHLSTHAFFLPSVEDELVIRKEDPYQHLQRFYLSGLVLTEAKRAHAARAGGTDVPFNEDGILFSDEVRNLPLHGTRLVTLSSCESGLGESVRGDGVLSLRRGFTLAGSSNVLISLWPVSDNSTPKFMETMYRLSLATDRIGQSLWETQRRTLADIDPADDAALEEAVLRYGCFVLCHRGPLQEAVEMPELKDESRKHFWAIGLALAAVLILVLTRRGKRA